jgi:hypothetical protein
MEKTITRTVIKLVALGLGIFPTYARSQDTESVDVRYICTFGSKYGIHPPRLTNKKAVVAATGHSDYPYGLGFPVGVTSDARGRVWITDNATKSVHVFDRDKGTYREIKRVGGVPLAQPAGIAADRLGRMFVVDTALANVFAFDENGEFDRPLLKPGAAVLQAPNAVALSEDQHTLYIVDPPQNAIVALNREGDVNAVIPLTEEAREPVSISVVQNQLYVLGLKYHRVAIVSPAGKPRGEIRWEGIPIPPAFTYDPWSQRFLVANPRLTVTEVFSGTGQPIGAFGQDGDGVDQNRRTSALQVDSQGFIYVVDSHNGKVLVFREGTGTRPGPPVTEPTRTLLPGKSSP